MYNLRHIPLIQPFIHATYLIELMFLGYDSKCNYNKYTQFADILNKNNENNPRNLENDKKSLIKFAETNEDIKKQKAYCLRKFLNMKLFETFLEGGPQCILQLSIIMQHGPSSYWQYITISTSIIRFCLSATGMFLNYPTNVRMMNFFLVMLVFSVIIFLFRILI